MTKVTLKIWRFPRAITTFALVACSAEGNDWPYWRGAEQTGMTRENAAVTSWSLEGENLLWKVPVGGRTTPVVMGGRLFTITPVGEGLGLRERVICLDAETGKTVWEQAFNVFDTDMVENRLGWTALVGDPETGNIYAHGTGGEFFCFDRDGKLLWKGSMTEEFGRISGYGGRLHTPILDEERVIISFLSSSWGNQAKPLHRYVAFDKKTGQVLWWSAPGSEPFDTSYSTPVVAVIGGKRMLIAGNSDGQVYGMMARTGEKVWNFKLCKRRGLNSSVVVEGNHVFASHSEENIDNTAMGRVVCIDASMQGDITASGEVWRLDGCEAGYASPAIAKGRLYVVTNSAELFCIDAKTGKVHWEHDLGRVGKGSPVVTADGVIYVGEQNGIFHILRDAGEKCESLDVQEFTRPDQLLDEFFGSPAVANGHVYFMTRYHTYGLGVKGNSAQPVAVPPAPPETASAGDAAGSLMVLPAEITLAPGSKLTFTARLLSADTTKSSETKVEWSVSGVKCQIGGDGNLTAATDNLFSAGLVTAKSQGVEGTARVRVCPKPPFEVDFESMAPDGVPPGWVGVARKTKVIERDGSKVLMKLAEDPSPPFMRIRPYLTPPIAGGYIVQADVLGLPKGTRSRPDMGVVNTRYGLMLMGVGKKLRLESWSSVPRIQHDVEFDWQTEKWYRMKLQVKLEGEQAKLAGKVWLRDEQEPQAWSIEFTDPYPNREGSPGLYGYSPGTTSKSKGEEIFYDNIKVTPNE